MSEYYAQTLIPGLVGFVPSPGQLQAFVSAMVTWGVIPGRPALTLRTPSGRAREVRNPLTGEMITLVKMDHKTLDGCDRIAESVESLADYEIEVSGQGVPTVPPLAIDTAEPYHVGLTCRVSSQLRSTSDPDHGWGPPSTNLSYGSPCATAVQAGSFQNPHNGEPIQVPGAGCAQFWLEFELGKFLFPKIEGNNLEVLNPAIVAEAERTFGTPFVQGCYWG